MNEIVTERLVLRLLQVEDVPAFAAYRSDPDVARYQSWDAAYTVADGERLVAAQQGVDFGDRGPWVQIAAVERATGALCGDCAVRVLDDQPRTAEVGVTFARAYQGTGRATEALAAVITRLFAEHDMHRVYAQADDRNVAVHRLLERLAFRCEARLVEADWFKGEWTTLRTYAILRREWTRARIGSPQERGATG
jgi:RimJ/RimL family protein N-acetyltransferase